MSYRGMEPYAAAAGLGQTRWVPNGPTGISPPWRKYGFHSFQGLGIDRLVAGQQQQWVTEFSPRGLSGGQPAQVPGVVRRAMERAGFRNVDAEWKAGGKVWVRYGVGYGAPSDWERIKSDSTYRRGKVRTALTNAARGVGSGVYFLFGSGERLPRAPGGVVTELPEIAIAATIPRSTVSVRDLQNKLRSKGFNPGRVDGVWGTNTSGALRQATQATGLPSGPAPVGSDDRRSVQLPTSIWAAIGRLPDRAPPSTPAPPAPAPVVSDIAPELEGEGLPQWLPWTLGAAALLGIGGYFVWQGRKGGRKGGRRAVAANRRRRRRKGRRRTSRRR